MKIFYRIIIFILLITPRIANAQSPSENYYNPLVILDIVTQEVNMVGNIPFTSETVYNSIVNVNDSIQDNNGSTSNVATIEITVSPNSFVDIVLTKIANNTTPNIGDEVTYTITATNKGNISATNLIVTESLPFGLTLMSLELSAGTWTTPDWKIGTLESNSTVSMTLVARVEAGTSGDVITNTITNTQDQTDSNISIDDNSASITVQGNSFTDIVLTKTVDNSTPNEGDEVTFIITATNNGNATATNLVITDNMPSGLTMLSASLTKGTWSTPDWNVGTLEANSSASITIVARVNAGTSGESIINSVSNTQDQTDKNIDSDDNSETINVQNSSYTDIVLTKNVDVTSPKEGDNITFTITATNIGSVQATNLVVSDNLPAGLSLVSVTPSRGTWSAPNWNIGTLERNSTVSLIIVTTVNDGTAGNSIINTISNSQDQTDKNIGFDDDFEIISVIISKHAPVANTDYAEIEMNSSNTNIDVAENDTDIDNNLNISSIIIISSTSDDSEIEVQSDGSIIYTPGYNFYGVDTIVYQIFDYTGLSDIDTIFITVKPDLFVPEGISPNNDGFNDYLIIPGIDELDNELRIFNRWGVQVFHKVNYRNDVEAWNGMAQNNVTLGNSKLPVGTYFYVLIVEGYDKPIKGFIYLQY